MFSLSFADILCTVNCEQIYFKDKSVWENIGKFSPSTINSFLVSV